jgi:hypothetical protein
MDASEVLKLIQKTAVEAARTTVTAIPGDPRHAVLTTAGVAETIEIPFDPPPRNHSIESLDDVIAFVTTDGLTTKPVVWHDQAGVLVQLNYDDRRERAGMKLRKTPAFELLERLDGDPAILDQRSLIQTLSRTLAVQREVVAKFRRVDFKLLQEGSAKLDRGKESLGKTVEAMVQGVEELPEEIFVDTAIYENAGEDQSYRLKLYCEPDCQRQVFMLGMMPGEVAHALAQHQNTIRSRLEAGLPGVPVFAGQA